MMMANRNLIQNLTLVTQTQKQTEYAVQHTKTGLWVGAYYTWVDSPEHALRFDFMTMALAHVVDMNYTPDDFKVEAV